VEPIKTNNTYKGYLSYESEFSHKYACWANNHMGWAKMKKFNKRLAKRKHKREINKEIESERSDE
jgi:hypothetical protein